MIRAILIDDEINSIETLGILLANYCPEVEVMDKCMSAKKGLLKSYFWTLKCL